MLKIFKFPKRKIVQITYGDGSSHYRVAVKEAFTSSWRWVGEYNTLYCSDAFALCFDDSDSANKAVDKYINKKRQSSIIERKVVKR